MFERVVFIGSKELGYAVLKEIYKQSPSKLIACITLDDSKETRSKRKEIDGFCKENDVPIHILSGNYDISNLINEYKPDLCIVVGWYYIFKSELLEKVRGGFIGIHNSILPKYRGFAPLVWQMINGESKVGYSLFKFDDGMDTGDIYYQEEIPILKSDPVGEVIIKIEKSVLRFFESKYINLLNEELVPYHQENIKASYCAKRVETDGKIDWTLCASRIYDFIRAQSKPYPGTFTYYNEKKIVIWNAEIFPNLLYGTPGQVGIIDKKNGIVIISCAENTGLILKEVECDGEKYNVSEIFKSLSIMLH